MSASEKMVINRDHVRSRGAFKQIQIVQRTPDLQEGYGRLALKLPFLIRTAGLAQALAFVDQKSYGKQGDRVVLLYSIVNDVAMTVGEVLGERLDGAGLMRKARETDDPAEYLLLTQETLKVATWYKRLSTSILGVEDGGDV